MFLQLNTKRKPLLIIWISSLLILCFLFILLSYFAYQGEIEIDKLLMAWYQDSFDSGVWIKAMEIVSFPGNGYNWAIAMGITFAICIAFKKPSAGLLVLSSGVAYSLNFLLKELIQRARPLATEVNVIGEAESDFGFPSGHVTSYVALFGVIFLLATIYVKMIWLKRLLQVTSILLILLVGPSRMTLGMHWPSDVLAGCLFGSIFLLIGVPAFFIFHAREVAK